jgi:hypothetical protein
MECMKDDEAIRARVKGIKLREETEILCEALGEEARQDALLGKCVSGWSQEWKLSYFGSIVGTS